jgi:hypothetical protein
MDVKTLLEGMAGLAEQLGLKNKPKNYLTPALIQASLARTLGALGEPALAKTLTQGPTGMLLQISNLALALETVSKSRGSVSPSTPLQAPAEAAILKPSATNAPAVVSLPPPSPPLNSVVAPVMAPAAIVASVLPNLSGGSRTSAEALQSAWRASLPMRQLQSKQAVVEAMLPNLSGVSRACAEAILKK